jgi:hypothetical protein
MDLSKYENHFDLCDAAINCEIASGENGKRHIRFISGMEPGTKIYDLISLMAGAPEHTSFWNENLHVRSLEPKTKYEHYMPFLKEWENEIDPNNTYLHNFATLLQKLDGAVINDYPTSRTHISMGNGKVEFGCGKHTPYNVSQMMTSALFEGCKSAGCVAASNKNAITKTVDWVQPDESGTTQYMPQSGTWSLVAMGWYPESTFQRLLLYCLS